MLELVRFGSSNFRSRGHWTSLKVPHVSLNLWTPTLGLYVHIPEHLKLFARDNDFDHGEDVDEQLRDDYEPEETLDLFACTCESEQVGAKRNSGDRRTHDPGRLGDKVPLHGFETLFRCEAILLLSEAVVDRTSIERRVCETRDLPRSVMAVYREHPLTKASSIQ